MKVWILNNRWSITLFAASALVFCFGVAASGCQMSDLITVDVPKDVKEATGTEGNVSLTQLPDLWDDWEAYVKKNTDQLDASTEKSYELLGFINSATDMAISAAGGAAPAFPGGAILVGLLSGGAGLLLKKPGTDRKIAAEKEASYNAGIEKARELRGVFMPDNTEGD